jgi:hypothetical protein
VFPKITCASVRNFVSGSALFRILLELVLRLINFDGRSFWSSKDDGRWGIEHPAQWLCSAFCASSIVLVLRRRPRLRIEADREDRQRIEGRESSGGKFVRAPVTISFPGATRAIEAKTLATDALSQAAHSNASMGVIEIIKHIMKLFVAWGFLANAGSRWDLRIVIVIVVLGWGSKRIARSSSRSGIGADREDGQRIGEGIKRWKNSFAPLVIVRSEVEPPVSSVREPLEFRKPGPAW